MRQGVFQKCLDKQIHSSFAYIRKTKVLILLSQVFKNNVINLHIHNSMTMK